MVALETSKLFHTLSKEDFCRVLQVVQIRNFAAGEKIFKAGDPGDGIYIVKSGTVEVSAIVGEEERVLSILEAGDLLGEMAVLDNDPRSATAIAKDAVVLYFIGRLELLQLLERIPTLSACLVREISRRLRDFNQRYIQETLQAERLALVGRFTRSIVHDLKNPLNIIGVAAELACMDNSKPETRVTAKARIRKQLDRITNMVNELVEFTRNAQTNVVLNPMDYAGFITSLVDELRPELSARSIALEVESPVPPVTVKMNPQRLARVFHNLVHNSTDALGGPGKIIFRFSRNGDYVVTEIEDTGPGIAAEIQDRLFQAFATYGKANGTGLGLSICKRIIEDHQGQIAARSQPGQGAIFIFTLPVAHDN